MDFHYLEFEPIINKVEIDACRMLNCAWTIIIYFSILSNTCYLCIKIFANNIVGRPTMEYLQHNFFLILFICRHFFLTTFIFYINKARE